jgi:putative DNA primase/helicase
MTTDAEFLSGMMYGNNANGKDTAKTSRNTTDLGNAERLLDRHGEDLKYVHAWGRYLVYDGQRYEPDQCDAVKAKATETVRNIYHEAGDALDEGERKALGSHAKKSEAQRGIEAMLSLAQHMVAVKPKDLDADPWTLNVLNGTVDLKTGELLPHSRADLITKLAPVEYDPDAKAPVFEAFLEKVLPSEALRKFVQRAIGYSLTGDISEQSLFFLHGSGANGKTTLMNVVLGLTGEYGKQAAPDLLVAKRGSHPTELADLFGARFVASTEVEDGARFAESLVKQLTGGDRIKARFMRQDFWEFDPTHKVWLSANHKPAVKGTDHAIWRRIKLIPFGVTIPKAEQDPRLPEKLQEELPGILAWAVRGCLEWARGGLGEPKEVTQATESYRAEQDVLAAFIEECCVVEAGAWCKFKDLFAAYQAWGAESGEPTETKRRFGNRLTERRFEKGNGTDNVAIRRGLALLHVEGTRL